ncbi:capsule biosynthesis protein CapA [Niabella ginsenosidivorans]|uniref:Capsule biosynthesis protein CapA n=2 Tax=Niabella ginsenosidivorans TaxID=1176587 RepID=A0A1A9I9S4_9BACT|nr:capsule biosynthesis protein CapA [Niabella ginsenosidivorans]
MLGSDYPNRSGLPKHNILHTLADSLKTGHFLLGNMEGVITNAPTPEKKCADPGNCYVFRMPPGTENFFKQAGFDFLSLANNHSGDFGNQGLKQTMELLDKAGIHYAGIKTHYPYTIIKKGGIRYGIIGVGFGWRHLRINQQQLVANHIKKIRDSTDILMVFFHGGAEGDTTEHVPRKSEQFHGENRGNVYAFARSCVDAGADLVLGSGPHVTRGIELYKNKLIAYSLGNYATYGSISLRGPMGIAPILKIRVNKKGDFVNGRIISTMQLPANDHTPRLDPAKKVLTRMQHLSKKDFPESPLTITQKGDIIIKNF